MEPTGAATLTVLLSAVLCIAALIVELMRPHPHGLVDFQFTSTCVYVALFGMAPILVFFAWEAGKIPGEWYFVVNLPPVNAWYAYAVAVALVAYPLLLLGIALGRGAAKADRHLVRPRLLIVAGVGLTVIGMGSLYLYARDIGGIQFMLETVMAYRAQAEPVYSTFGFLKTLSPIATAGAFLLFAALQTPQRSAFLYLAFGVALLGAATALLVNGGRLMVIQFLITFPLYYLFRHGWKKAVPTVTAVLLISGGVIVFGHGLFDLFRGSERLAEEFETVGQSPADVGINVGLEFSFPVESLAVTLRDVGTVPSEHRWFSDVPIGIAYLLPKRLLSLELPETVSMELTQLVNGPVPADLLSFGYWSAGPFGLVLVVVAFGWLISRFESWFPLSVDPVMLTLRAAWVAYLCSRVMYGNPHHTYITAMPLVAATVVIFATTRRKSASHG